MFQKIKLPVKVTLSVVLVRTIYDRNIGFVSRAMSNMGFERLILVDPQCGITYEAQLGAATGQHALQNRTTYSSWQEFYSKEPDGLRISLTARDGKGRDVQDFKNLLVHLSESSPYFLNESDDTSETTKELPHSFVYLIFGPEDAGLNTHDINNTHVCASLPTYGDNWSLNLSQAVLLSLFIFKDTFGGTRTTLDGEACKSSNKKIPPPLSIFPDETLRAWLEIMGVDLSKEKVNAFTVLKRMIFRSTPSIKELQMLETMLQQTIRKLKKLKSLEKNEKFNRGF